MVKTTLTFTTLLVAGAYAGTARADYNSELRVRAQKLVQGVSGETPTDPKLTLAISVYKAHLRSLLEDGYINMRLSAKYPKTDEFYDHLRANQGDPRPLFIREDKELDMARDLRVPEPGISSWFVPELFPKYALVGMEDSAKCTGDILAPGIAQTRGYGDIWIQLNKDVNARATYTLGDSLDDKLTPAPLARLTASDFEFQPRIDRYTDQVSGQYVEAQVWGPITAADVAAIWVPNSSDASEVKAVAETFAIPVHVIAITTPRPYKDCVAVAPATTLPDRPAVATDRVAALKREYAEIMAAIRAELRKPSIDGPAWQQLQARRMRTLYYFVTRTAAEWSALNDGTSDELARQDEYILGMFRRAFDDVSGVKLESTVDGKLVERRFLAKGTSWKAFLDEVSFWCNRGARSETAAVASALSRTRAPDDFDLEAAFAAYQACDTTRTARDLRTMVSELARTSLSATPSDARTQLGGTIAQLAAAIGVPTLAAMISDKLVAIEKERILGQWRSAKSSVVEQEAATRMHADTKARVCADQPATRDAISSQLVTVERAFDIANRACNGLQTRLENDPSSEYSKLSGKELEAFRSKILPGLRAKDPDCIKAAELRVKRGALSTCQAAWDALGRSEQELERRRTDVRTLHARFPSLTSE